jgi:hypothetical protein
VAVVYSKVEPSEENKAALDGIFSKLGQEYKVEVVGEINTH